MPPDACHRDGEHGRMYLFANLLISLFPGDDHEGCPKPGPALRPQPGLSPLQSREQEPTGEETPPDLSTTSSDLQVKSAHAVIIR